MRIWIQLIILMRTRIQLWYGSGSSFNTDPDRDRDFTFEFDADPDPDPHHCPQHFHNQSSNPSWRKAGKNEHVGAGSGMVGRMIGSESRLNHSGSKGPVFKGANAVRYPNLEWCPGRVLPTADRARRRGGRQEGRAARGAGHQPHQCPSRAGRQSETPAQE